MKITYVILTCESMLKTRVPFLKNTWINNIDDDDEIYYLSSKSNLDENVIGYNDPDDYISAPLKMHSFFKNFNIDNSDWLFLCDDDTFVFPKRLKKELSKYNENINYYIGKKDYWSDMPYFESIETKNGKVFNVEYPFYCIHGGAGICINKRLFNELQYFLKNDTEKHLSYHGDVSLGYWIKKYISNYEIIHNSLFNMYSYNENSDFNNSIKYF